MTKVKICGLTRKEDVCTASRHGADWVGFVFFKKSPRYVTPAQGAELAALAAENPRLGRVGLFVKATDEEIRHVLDTVPLDILQIYDSRSRALAIARQFSKPVWWACAVRTAHDLPHDAAGLEALVVEAPPPAHATRPGGNGQSFDWSITRGWQAPAPWLLAGGLTPENVADSVEKTGAPAVDVSSGVEEAPGRKDLEKIKEFIRNAKYT